MASTTGAAAGEIEIVLRMALDGSMLVHESFTLAAGERGIERTIPQSSGIGERFVIDIMHAERDGTAIGWQEKVSGDELTVRLPRVAGARRHGLLYHVDGHLALAQGREWLLWRPLGPGLDLALERLDVAVTFPRAIPGREIRVQGAGPDRGRETTVDDEGRVQVRWDGPLAAGTAPALLVSWPAGYLRPEADSDSEPWLRPTAAALWWSAAGLAAFAGALVAARGRSQATRRALFVGALAFAATALWAAGHLAALYPGAFGIEFAALACAIGFMFLARSWLDRPRYRVAYVVLAVLLVAVPVYRLVHNVSPWFPLLVLANADLAWATWIRMTRRHTGGEARSRGRGAVRVPAPTPADDRRAPYFDRAPLPPRPAPRSEPRL